MLWVDRSSWMRVEAWFFHNFFLFLLVGVSVAQAGVAWWVARQWYPLGIASFALLAVTITSWNLWLARRRRNLQRNLVDRLPQLYHAVAFTCLFAAGVLLLNHLAWRTTAFGHALVTAEARGLGRPEGPLRAGPIDERATGWMGLFGTAALFAYGYTLGQRRLAVREVRVALPQWPAGTPPLRVVQLSDIHVGTNMTPHQLAHYVRRVQALAPDLVCITGDIADNARSDLERDFPILGQLHARYGVVAILGNHDHYAGAARVTAALKRHTRFTVLCDAAITVTTPAGRLHVVGLDDRGQDWARGVTSVPVLEEISRQLPTNEPRILLSHRPDIFPQAAELGFHLVLSGHTHGGQIAFPWLGGRSLSLAQLVTRFDRGLFRSGASLLYVNCGLGVTGQRIRLWTPREITVLSLYGSGPQISSHASAP